MKSRLIRLLPLGMIACLFSAPSAWADGFRCATQDDALHAKIYHHTTRAAGTRKVAVIILSDGERVFGERTIAKFESENDEMMNYGADYIINVDRDLDASAESDANLVLGIPLDAIKTIELHVAFSYTTPVEDGTLLEGSVRITRNDGSFIEEPLTCSRYLKRD